LLLESNNRIIPIKEKIIISFGFLKLINEARKDKKLKPRRHKIKKQESFVINSFPVRELTTKVRLP